MLKGRLNITWCKYERFFLRLDIEEEWPELFWLDVGGSLPQSSGDSTELILQNVDIQVFVDKM